MNRLNIFLLVVSCCVSGYSAAHAGNEDYHGNWQPSSTTSISITGSIRVEKDRIVFYGRKTIHMSNGRKRGFQDSTFGDTDFDQFDIVGTKTVDGLNKNVLRRSNEDTVLISQKDKGQLLVLICDHRKMSKASPLEGCSSYSYERP